MQKKHGLTIQDPQAETRKTPETAHGLDNIAPSKNQNDKLLYIMVILACH